MVDWLNGNTKDKFFITRILAVLWGPGGSFGLIRVKEYHAHEHLCIYKSVDTVFEPIQRLWNTSCSKSIRRLAISTVQAAE